MNGEIRPQGLLTEYDLVLEVLAAKIDPSVLKAGDIMTCEQSCVTKIRDIREALKYLRYHNVRLALVFNVNGLLVFYLALKIYWPHYQKSLINL